MGGSYSLQTSVLAGQNGIACVMYYGFPETDTEKLKSLNADVLMIWANEDKWITKEVVDQFKTNMSTAEKKLTVKEYTADHAFANPSNPKFNEVAMKDAYAITLAFLRSKFK
jgi:carboxymethylenebutenolidase